MNKPWDFTAAPNTDKIEQYVECEGQFFNAVDGDFARNLERRLRHAERLLEKSWKTRELEDIDQLHDDVMEHLEAAEAEDNA